MTLFPCLDYVGRGILCPHISISIHVWSIGASVCWQGFTTTFFRIDEIQAPHFLFMNISVCRSRGQQTELMNNLKQLIGEFLQTVPSGTIIDAHTVINFLWERHSDVYLACHPNGLAMKSFHGIISGAIDSFDGELLRALPNESFSRTLSGSYTANKCWIKLWRSDEETVFIDGFNANCCMLL